MLSEMEGTVGRTERRRIQVELYPSSQLGSKSDIINQEIAGDSAITLANGAFYADLGVSDFSVTFAPTFSGHGKI